MKTPLHNKKFEADYLMLKNVSLDPARHTAANAYEHCQMVAERVVELAKLNQCSEDEEDILIMLAKLHDIGKIRGNAKPQESLDLLEGYGDIDTGFYELVKYHDINLPWYISHQKGQTPSDKAWKKLAGKVELRLLCLFMIADRVDCPGGWQANQALVWFIDQTQQRGYLTTSLTTDQVKNP